MSILDGLANAAPAGSSAAAAWPRSRAIRSSTGLAARRGIAHILITWGSHWTSPASGPDMWLAHARWPLRGWRHAPSPAPTPYVTMAAICPAVMGQQCIRLC